MVEIETITIEELNENIRSEILTVKFDGVTCGLMQFLKGTLKVRIPVKRLYFENWETNSKLLNKKFIQNRLSQVPLKQSIDNKKVMSLNVKNNTNSTINIYTTDINGVGTNVNKMILFTLSKFNHIDIPEIIIKSKTGYENSIFNSVISSTRYNYDSPSVANVANACTFNPANFTFTVDTNGDINVYETLILAFKDMINKTSKILDFTVSENYAKIELPHEIDSFGLMLKHAFYDEKNDRFFKYNTDDNDLLTIEIKGDNLEKVIPMIIEKTVKNIAGILNNFKGKKITRKNTVIPKLKST